MKKSLFAVVFCAGFSFIQGSDKRKIDKSPSSSFIHRPWSTDEMRSPSTTPRSASVAQSSLFNESFNSERFSTVVSPVNVFSCPRSNSNLTANLKEADKIATPIKQAVVKGDFDTFVSLVDEQANQGFFVRAHTSGSPEAIALQIIAQNAAELPDNNIFLGVLAKSHQASSPKQRSIDNLRAIYNALIFNPKASIEDLRSVRRKIEALSRME